MSWAACRLANYIQQHPTGKEPLPQHLVSTDIRDTPRQPAFARDAPR